MGIVKFVGTHPSVLRIEIRHTQITETYEITIRWELTKFITTCPNVHQMSKHMMLSQENAARNVNRIQ
jgi:hypothetical protein